MTDKRSIERDATYNKKIKQHTMHEQAQMPVAASGCRTFMKSGELGDSIVR
jgi:hypothetical protein